jgi:membrane protease YdiL (CAAX protease family)
MIWLNKIFPQAQELAMDTAADLEYSPAQPQSEFILAKLFRFAVTLFFIFYSCTLVFMQMLAPYFFPKSHGAFDMHNYFTFYYFIAYTFLWSVVVPVAINRIYPNRPLKSYGWQMPANKIQAGYLTIGAMLILVPCIYHFAMQPGFQAYYYLGKPTLERIFIVNVLMMPMYYFSEEFFFRGYLFLGLYRRVGLHSFWITDIIFTYSHLGKPLPEILLCIPASIIFNFLTLKTKSFYPALIVHLTMGIVLNLVVAFTVAK